MLSPDLVVKLAGPSDEAHSGVSSLHLKMNLYLANGARLGWLLLPGERAVEIWRGGQLENADRLVNATWLDGGALAEGVGLELEQISAV